MKTKSKILMFILSVSGIVWGIIKPYKPKEIPLSELAKIANEKKGRK